MLFLIIYLERQFQVFTSPDIHSWVIQAQLLKVSFTDSKQTPSHRRRPEVIKSCIKVIDLNHIHNQVIVTQLRT